MGWQAAISGTGRAIWLSTPFFAALALTLLTMAPLDLFPGPLTAPNFAVIAVFFWALYAPQFFPPLAVFSLGLGMDLLGSGPIGFWTLLLLGLYGAVLSQRAFFLGRSVFGVWMGFAGFALALAVLGWFVQCLYFGRWSNISTPLLQALISIAVFPIAGRLFFGLRRLLTAAPERTYS